MVFLTASLFLILVIYFVVGGHYTRRVDVLGEVTSLPHAVTLSASQQGFVKQAHVKIGDTVNKGDPIYTINVSQTSRDGVVSTNNHLSIEKQITYLDDIIKKIEKNKENTIETLKVKKQEQLESHKQTVKFMESIRDSVNAAEKVLKNYKHYKNKGLITEDQLTAQTSAYYQLKASYQNFYMQSI